MRNPDDYIRVTTCLSPIAGLNCVPPSILQKAAERGQVVHDICNALIEGIGLPSYEESYKGYVDSFNLWNDDKTFIEKPPRFYCDTYMFTGEIDGIYKDKNGHLVLIDFKTPMKESKTWAHQASAYSYLCKIHGYDISRIEFIKLCKEGKKAKVYEYKENFDEFLKRLNLYRYFFNNKKDDEYIELVKTYIYYFNISMTEDLSSNTYK